MPPHYGHLIRVLHSATDQTITRSLEEMELTAAQGHLMAYLSRCDAPPCPRDVEDRFHLSHPTVSGLLSRLEKKGFISLEPDESDRRCKRIHVLEKGWACHDIMRQTIDKNETRLVQGFSPEEREQFLALLLRAISNLGIDPYQLPPKEETSK